MNEQEAKDFGSYLRSIRLRLGYGNRELSRLSGVDQSAIARIEAGQILTPAPAKLVALARALAVDPAEVLQRAGHGVSVDLLQPATYLRTRFADLPAQDLEALQQEVAAVLRRHGIESSDGPAPGEDELPGSDEPSDHSHHKQ